MKRFPMPMTPTPSPSSIHAGSGRSPVMQDLLWISKQQQQHPSTHAHPLKNTIRVSSNGIRHKFDGKQWRPLCKSPDAYECRNLAFRSSLCQKHFYKLHLFKRPYLKNRPAAPSDVAPMSFKRPISQVYEHKQGTDDDVDGDDSIQLLENYDVSGVDLHRLVLIPGYSSQCPPSDIALKRKKIIDQNWLSSLSIIILNGKMIRRISMARDRNL